MEVGLADERFADFRDLSRIDQEGWVFVDDLPLQHPPAPSPDGPEPSVDGRGFSPQFMQLRHLPQNIQGSYLGRQHGMPLALQVAEKTIQLDPFVFDGSVGATEDGFVVFQITLKERI